jgi:hypothetical protein
VRAAKGAARGEEVVVAKFLLTIWTEELPEGAVSPEEGEKQMMAYQQVTDDMRSAGAFSAGEGLQPSRTAKTVRVRDGQPQTTDGPFAETKEQLGGFYLLESKDEAEAVEWAARIPGASFGAVEVRGIIDYPEPPK